MRQGFTLVELAIVLVIIGLITGGILVGSSMIRAAELHNVVKDAEKYKAAVHAFRSKYSALPGDMPNATRFWGQVAAGCTFQPGTGTRTCNGDGDGTIGGFQPADSHETMRYWQHLGLAGLIEGNFSGAMLTVGSYCHLIPGVTAPIAISESVFIPYIYTGGTNFIMALRCSANTVIGSSGGFLQRRNQVHYLGLVSTSIYLGYQDIEPPQINGTDALSIDAKIDDGLPAYGAVVASPLGCTTTNVPATAAYVSSSTNACLLYFKML